MPLISGMPPREDEVETFQETGVVKRQEPAVQVEKDQDRGCEEDFVQFDEDAGVDSSSDMEGSILHRPRPKKVVKVPAVPQRSEQRASRILDNVVLELKALNGTRSKEEGRNRVDEEDPLEQYLSSEEDASLSDDYEDSESLLDFDGTFSEVEEGGSSSRPSSRRSQEVTARVVSFIVVGKPQIIEINIPSSNNSPITPAEETLDSQIPIIKAPSPAFSQPRPAMRRPPPLNLSQTRPMSVATSSASAYSFSSSYIPPKPTNASMVNLSRPQTNTDSPHPQRKSSRLASLVTSTKTLSARAFSASATSTHSFLDTDPFAQSSSHSIPPLTPTDHTIPATPKTPTSMSSSAWKKSISKSLTKATRKPSLQKLNAAYNSSVLSVSSTHRASTMSAATMPTLSRITSNPEPTTPGLEDNREAELHVRRAETMPVTPSPRHSVFRPEDVMIPPPVPENPQPREREGRKSFSLSLGRKKSMKGR